MDCIFCNIASKKIGSDVVYEDEDSIAVMDINPVSLGHVLLIPKQHARDINPAINQALVKLAGKIKESVNADNIGLNVASNMVEQFGHIGVHIIPQYEQERKFSKEDTSKIANDIRNSLVDKTFEQPFRKALAKKSLDGKKVKEVPKEEKKIIVFPQNQVDYWLEERIP